MKQTDEIDDLGKDKDVMRQRKEKAAYLEMLRKSMAIIKDAFNAKASSKKNIKSFLLYKSINLPSVIEAFTGEWNNKSIYISTIEYHTSSVAGKYRSSGTDVYLIGVVTLRESYPHILIKPEVLALKIENIFTKMDVDFKHAKLFSFLFYVITKDKAALELRFQSLELNRLTKFLDAEIEIIGTSCYFRVSRKSISEKEASKFVELGKVIAEVF